MNRLTLTLQAGILVYAPDDAGTLVTFEEASVIENDLMIKTENLRTLRNMLLNGEVENAVCFARDLTTLDKE